MCVRIHMTNMNQQFDTDYSFQSLSSEDILPKNQVNSLIANFYSFKFYY